LSDIEVLVGALTELAKEFSISWELSIEDANIGSTGADGPDPSLNQTLPEMIVIFGSGMSDEAIDSVMPDEETDSALPTEVLQPVLPDELGMKPRSKPWWKFWKLN
jgi:hypothetical protein